MRTSLNRIKAIEDYLMGRLQTEDRPVFETNSILNDELKNDIALQQHAYEMIRQYSRQTIRAEIKAAHETITTAPQHRGFMQRITKIFNHGYK